MAVTAQDLPYDGEKLLGFKPAVMKVAKKILYASDAGDCGTFDLFDLSSDMWVKEVRTQVATAFTASVTITIGDSDDVDGWLTAATIAATTAVATGLMKSSMTSDSDNSYGMARGRKYGTAQPIQAVIAGAAPAVGTLNVYLEYADFGGL